VEHVSGEIDTDGTPLPPGSAARLREAIIAAKHELLHRGRGNAEAHV
jgi:hypothetical protein